MKIINKKARFDYKLFEKFEAGVVLTGSEAKAVKKGSVDLKSAHAKTIGNEIYLVNTNISANNVERPTRSRKLLLHKKQIVAIQTKIKAKRLTLVPTKIYTKGRLIKIEIAIAKAKRKYQKKESLKEKDIKREIERGLRGSKDNDKRI